MYVTEDTTRAKPDDLRRLYTAAIEAGARRICVADTVGHATPEGARAVIKFVRKVVAETGEDVKVDWHGHRDRGLDVANALAAVEAGADRLHGTCLGVGERVGNTPIDLLLVNLELLGWSNRDLSRLSDYCKKVHECTGVPYPGQLSGGGTRRLPHRHRRPRRGHHQGAGEGRRVARRPRLLERAGVHGRRAPDHRDRSRCAVCQT